MKKNIGKKIFALVIGITSLFFAGCGSEQIFSNLYFEKYDIPLTITTTFEKKDISKEEDSLLQNKIISIYQEINSTPESEETIDQPFRESIIILKTENIYNNLDTFVDENIEKINKVNLDTDGNTTTEMENCIEKINISTNKRYFDNSGGDDEYFVQSFFLEGNNAYIIAYSTKNKENYSQIYKDFQNISCKTQENKQYEV